VGVIHDITEKRRLEQEKDDAKEEKGKREDELEIAKAEKGKREDELVIANKELAFQNVEKDKRANELITANHKLALKNEENEYLLKKLKRAASVFTSADESIMITDVNGVIIEVNAAFSRITGYDSVEVLGKHPIFLQSKCHPP
jgi:PAS domain-containing protein